MKKLYLNLFITFNIIVILFKVRKNKLPILKKVYHKAKAMEIKLDAYEAKEITDRVVKIAKVLIIVYPKDTICIQRSLVVYYLLKKLGVDCEIEYGFRIKPFYMHSWVEVNNEVVFDSPRERWLFLKSKMRYLD